MGAIVPFIFDDQAVRVTDQNGEPWFVLADVCAILGLKNPTMAAKPLDETEKAKLCLGGAGSEATIVSLSGLITLMVRCQGAMRPGTIPYRVRKWITSEVVPTIMRTGGYGNARPVDPLTLDDATLRALLLGKMDQVGELQPKAEALDRLADATGLLCITDAAKALKVPPRRLFAWLEAHHWIYRRGEAGHWVAFGTRLNSGVLEHKGHTVQVRGRPDKWVEQVMVTPKGLARLAAERAGQ